MDEVLKKIFKALEDGDAEVKVIKIEKPDGTGEPKPVDKMEDAKKEAAEIAELNRILYEAHINAGFTTEEALAMTIAAMNN